MSNQENISKETKKTRRKRSHRTAQQIKLAVIMIMVSVLVLSASTFAWYRMSKIASIQSMEFKADTLGNLLISDKEDGEYDNTLDLGLGENNQAVLLPATTADGVNFSKPVYNKTGDVVENIEDIDIDKEMLDGTEMKKNTYEDNGFDHYVYKKDFYIKLEGAADDEKNYELWLVASDEYFNTGTYLDDKDDDEAHDFDSLNAVRISFVVGDATQAAVVYEPYCVGNGEGDVTQKNDDNTPIGTYADKSAITLAGPTVYNTMLVKQASTGELTENKSLTTMQVDDITKVTMYVWFEGMDDDCVNEIALDVISGQIQFEAKEEEPVTP